MITPQRAPLSGWQVSTPSRSIYLSIELKETFDQTMQIECTATHRSSGGWKIVANARHPQSESKILNCILFMGGAYFSINDTDAEDLAQLLGIPRWKISPDRQAA